jgi:RHS repeat-associated protein
MVFALQVSRAPNVAGGTLSAGNPAIGANQPSSLRYMHHDHLGSVAVVTNETGAVLERLAFDPWGKRRNINGLADTTDSLVGLTTDRGYTEHEHLDEMGVIHMNGRIYDPLIGRMMSADPFIQAPAALQSYNRYSYVMNNPLNLTDPSGYWSLNNFLSNLDNFTRNPTSGNAFTLHRSVPGVVSVDNYVVKHNWAFQIGRAAAGAWGGPWAAAGATGYYTYLTTGCESCSVKAFGLSLATSYAFEKAGDAAEGREYGAGHYASHAAVGCASSVAGGGQCGAGALSAVAGLAGTQFGGSTMAGRFASSVIAGGVASRLAGGSFIDGAQTAAYGFLFNECAHTKCVGGSYGHGPDEHFYMQMTLLDSNCSGDCLQILKEGAQFFSAPGYGMQPVPFEDGGLRTVFIRAPFTSETPGSYTFPVGRVVQTMGADGSITNTTLNDHLACCGTVNRTVLQVNKSAYMLTLGQGTNLNGLFLRMNEFYGPKAFGTLDQQLIRAVRK